MTARRQDGSDDRAIYIISVAAELAGVHPQTLRVYERKGLVRPSRTQGNTRRYSASDIERLKRIQELTNEGVNLAGVLRIIELEKQIEELRSSRDRALEAVSERDQHIQDLMDARGTMALVPFKDIRRVRRALKSDAIDAATKRRTFHVPPASS
ncbi:MAG TPA: helix-turn-helix transcriptional regulator [Actinomycetota bacterium]|nr:helix-turn-helix transcriptional regulator [Actinomycetota bacterium]